MEKITVAFASDNKINLSKEHFGEAKEYFIYDISITATKFVNLITNISPEEKMHGDPNKARGVSAILKPHYVQVVVNKAFGKNINRMKKQFVCIISQTDSIDESIKNIQLGFNNIVSEYEKGEERNFLKL